MQEIKLNLDVEQAEMLFTALVNKFHLMRKFRQQTKDKDLLNIQLQREQKLVQMLNQLVPELNKAFPATYSDKGGENK